ncbi:hypothetical protein RN607_00585 [Demequina capsici]|uniref:Uncharacterized protein n=1 Tax=Demequina capsici TaxID=3075620 RepID=A0AA96FDD5_9MICO|nr:hypothetical protein [Demequina sp. PMTSA13]WNM27529.1 hypothetical protein RN607_00585 [Demequina sp. PMTSA13]
MTAPDTDAEDVLSAAAEAMERLHKQLLESDHLLAEKIKQAKTDQARAVLLAAAACDRASITGRMVYALFGLTLQGFADIIEPEADK